jgi:hypothetical protein
MPAITAVIPLVCCGWQWLVLVFALLVFPPLLPAAAAAAIGTKATETRR